MCFYFTVHAFTEQKGWVIIICIFYYLIIYSCWPYSLIGCYCNRCSISMMVKWTNDCLLQATDGKMLGNDGEMLVNDGEMLVNDGEMSLWSYTHFTIIDAHLTIIEMLHRLVHNGPPHGPHNDPPHGPLANDCRPQSMPGVRRRSTEEDNDDINNKHICTLIIIIHVLLIILNLWIVPSNFSLILISRTSSFTALGSEIDISYIRLKLPYPSLRWFNQGYFQQHFFSSLKIVVQ